MPCILNPQMRIATAIKTFGFSPELMREAPIGGYTCAVPCIKDWTFIFFDYRIREYTKTDIQGIARERAGQVFEVNPHNVAKVEIDKVIKLFKQTHALNIRFVSEEELISQIVRTYRKVFGQEPTAYPDMWLITDRNNQILTRLVWVDELRGSLDIYFAGNVVLIEADQIQIDEEFIYELRSVPEIRFSTKKLQKIAKFNKIREHYVDLLAQLTAEEEKETIVSVLTETEREKPVETRPEVKPEVKVETRGTEEEGKTKFEA